MSIVDVCYIMWIGIRVMIGFENDEMVDIDVDVDEMEVMDEFE